jgi:tetratricopeptide (TPR) repeat protein
MPNRVQALNMRAIIYSIRNQPIPAIEDLTAAIAADPRYAISYHRRAILYASAGKRSEAIADLKRFLDLETDPELRKPAEELLRSLGG